MVREHVLQMFLPLAACCEYSCYLTEQVLVIFSEPRAVKSEMNRQNNMKYYAFYKLNGWMPTGALLLPVIIQNNPQNHKVVETV